MPGASFHVQLVGTDTVLVTEKNTGGGMRTRRMKYYADNVNDSDDSLFYFQLAQRRTIEGAFIESLNLMKLESFDAILLKLNLPHPLRINDCIIYGTESPAYYQTEKPERVFSKTVAITNSVIYGSIDFANATFVDTFMIANTRIGGTLDLSRCKFQKPAIVTFSEIYSGVSLSDSRFHSAFQFTNSFVTEFIAGNTYFERTSHFNGTVFSDQVSFYHARFRKHTDFSNTTFDPSMSFSGAAFSGYTDLTHITIRQKEEKNNRRPSPPSDILLTKVNLADTVHADDNILSYGLDLIALKQIWFDLSGMEPTEAERFLTSVIQFVNSNANASEDLRADALARLNYQAVQLKRFHTDSWFERAQLDILQVLVRNGYGGGARFLISCLIMTLFFSLVYQAKYQGDIASFINKNSHENKPVVPPEAGKVRRLHAWTLKGTLNFVHAMWFSIYVFLSPKFPSEIFPRSYSFQLIVAAEWCLGIGMMMIYLVYIASNYGFIRSLLGF